MSRTTCSMDSDSGGDGDDDCGGYLRGWRYFVNGNGNCRFGQWWTRSLYGIGRRTVIKLYDAYA